MNNYLNLFAFFKVLKGKMNISNPDIFLASGKPFYSKKN